jgi:autotransporter-associated beta strand protein
MPTSRCAAIVLLAAFSNILAAPGEAAIYTWDGGAAASNSWGQADNWNPNGVPTFNTSADLLFNTLTRPDNDIGASRTIRSIAYGADMDGAFNTNLRTFNGGAAATLTMDTGTTDSATITIDAGATGNISVGWSGVGTAGGALSLTSNLAVTHNGNGEFAITRQINGVGGLTKLGSGTMRMGTANANGFSGPVNVDAGRLIANTTASSTGDFNSAAAINLGGGALEFRTSTNIAKTINPGISVTQSSTLAFNNTMTGTTQTLTIASGTSMNLGSALVIQNISADTTQLNLVNVARNMTGAGGVTVESYNNIAAIGDTFSLGRVQFSGTNAGWTGDLLVAKGVAQLSGTAGSSGSGDIRIGTTGDSFGAGLALNFSTDQTLANDITVTTGGFRAIKNNGSGALAITMTGGIALNGNLTIDGVLDAGKAFRLDGIISGTGNLTVSRSGTTAGSSATPGSTIVMSAANTYAGSTLVNNNGTLLVDGSLASAISIAGTALFGGNGSTSQSLTMDAGARFAFDPAATFDVIGATSLDNSFGVASLVMASGSAIDWTIIGDGTYTLIGLTPSSFSNITNYGIGNAASLGGGKLGYFDSSGGLQLVIVPEPSVSSLVAGGIALLALQRRRARALEPQGGR